MLLFQFFLSVVIFIIIIIEIRKSILNNSRRSFRNNSRRSLPRHRYRWLQ